MADINPAYPVRELTQAQYNALTEKDSGTLYCITDTPKYQASGDRFLETQLMTIEAYEALPVFENNVLYCIEPIQAFELLQAIESTSVPGKLIPHINLNYLFTRLSSITLKFGITEAAGNIYNIFGSSDLKWCLRETVSSDGLSENSLVFYNGSSRSGSGNMALFNKSFLQPNKEYVLQTNTYKCTIYEVGNTSNRHEWKTSYGMENFSGSLAQSNGTYLDGLKIGASACPQVISEEELSKPQFMSCGMRIYSCTVWEGSNLVMNMHPVRNTRTGECGLYDYKNEAFYRKAMTLTKEQADLYYSDYVGIAKS